MLKRIVIAYLMKMARAQSDKAIDEPWPGIDVDGHHALENIRHASECYANEDALRQAARILRRI